MTTTPEVTFGELVSSYLAERTPEALVSLRSTGDGTELSPWVVLRVSDEYDLLRAAGRRSVGQRLVDVAGVPCDRHELDDGSTVWFRLVA